MINKLFKRTAFLTILVMMVTLMLGTTAFAVEDTRTIISEVNGTSKSGDIEPNYGNSVTVIPKITLENENIEVMPGLVTGSNEEYPTTRMLGVKFESKPHICTVTFDANGGTVTPTSKEVITNSTYGDLPIPTNTSDVTFNGWYNEFMKANLVDVYNPDAFDNYVLRIGPGSTHNSGLFNAGDKIVFDVTFNDNKPLNVDINDTSVSSSQYTIEDNRIYGTITLTSSNIRTGYYSDYAFFDINCEKKVNGYTINDFKVFKNSVSSNPITSTTSFDADNSITLYAGWSPIKVGAVTYTVNYDVNGGTVQGGELTTRTVASGDTFTIAKLFQLPDEDYHITVHPPENKWFAAFEISGERYENGAKITITGNTVIKYLWKDITYVDKVELTIEPPVAGTKIEGEFNEILGRIDYDSITVRPIVTFPEGADYIVYSDEIYWTVSGESTPYLGELEAGKTYNAVVYVYCEDDSYQFLKEGLEVVVNGEKITTFDSQGFWVTVEYPMEAVSDLCTITFDLNGGIDSGRYPLEILSVEAGSKFKLPQHPEMPELTLVDNGSYIGVSAPEGKCFDAYEVSGERMNPGKKITINEDTAIKYLWKDIVYIDKVELIVEAPIVGTQIKADYNEETGMYDFNSLNVHSKVQVADSKLYATEDKYNYWISGDSNVFVGKIEKNKDYKTTILLYAVEDGTEFSEDVTVIINGKEVSGFYPMGGLLSGYYTIVSKSNNTTSSGGGGSSASSYKITTKIENGTITPSNASVKKNAEQEFTFKVNDGYEITDVLVDGKSVGIVNSYKLEKVTSKHTIEVKTQKIPVLINIDNWAKEEMAEAEERGLIPETFAKKDATKAITRLDFAAVAVKLYEAISGKKAEKATSNPFTDTSDEYVLKAYALGITKGTSETTFTPNAEITRAQMATMLTRALSKAGINTEYDITNTTRFADDNELSDWGRLSVYFMAKEEIIKGIGDNRFNGRR